MAVVEIAITPRPEFVGVVRLALGALARAESIEEEVLDDLRIAVSEACANAVVSSEESGSETPITVAWEARPDAIVVEVMDPTPDSPAASNGDPGTARLELSLALLRSLVDNLEHEQLPDGGSRTRMTLPR